jgi:hypothetical protein
MRCNYRLNLLLYRLFIFKLHDYLRVIPSRVLVLKNPNPNPMRA